MGVDRKKEAPKFGNMNYLGSMSHNPSLACIDLSNLGKIESNSTSTTEKLNIDKSHAAKAN